MSIAFIQYKTMIYETKCYTFNLTNYLLMVETLLEFASFGFRFVLLFDFNAQNKSIVFTVPIKFCYQ